MAYRHIWKVGDVAAGLLCYPRYRPFVFCTGAYPGLPKLKRMPDKQENVMASHSRLLPSKSPDHLSLCVDYRKSLRWSFHFYPILIWTFKDCLTKSAPLLFPSLPRTTPTDFIIKKGRYMIWSCSMSQEGDYCGRWGISWGVYIPPDTWSCWDSTRPRGGGRGPEEDMLQPRPCFAAHNKATERPQETDQHKEHSHYKHNTRG